MKISSYTIDGLEDALRIVDEGADSELELQGMMHDGPIPFCVEPLLWQLVVTMARKFEDQFVVRIMGFRQSDPNFSQDLEKLLGNAHIVFAFFLAGSVIDEDGVVIGKEVTATMGKYLEAMDAFDFANTTSSTATARAHFVFVQDEKNPSSIEFRRALYERDPDSDREVVRRYAELKLTIQGILAELNPAWQAKTLMDIGAPLARLVRELFENSDWWARSDETGALYPKGVRILSFRIVRLYKESAEVFLGGNTRMFEYVNKALESGERDFIEIAVVDSGPGLARRWLGRKGGARVNLSGVESTEEGTAVGRCFGKRMSTSDSPERGIGLFAVAQMLKRRNGFMRVRTGRTAYLFGTPSAMRDVTNLLKKADLAGAQDGVRLKDGTLVIFEHGDAEVKNPSFFLQPWSNRKFSETFGTSFSVMLPVD
jgi:hypothetical protein